MKKTLSFQSMVLEHLREVPSTQASRLPQKLTQNEPQIETRRKMGEKNLWNLGLGRVLRPDPTRPSLKDKSCVNTL